MKKRPPVAITCAALACCSPFAAAQDSTSRAAVDVRAITAEVIADTSSRSSLQPAIPGGYDGAFFIQSPDRNFRLQAKGFLQFRYQANFSDGNSIGDDFESGFSNPRTLLFFQGHIFDPKLAYQIRMNFSASTGAATLDDAFVNYKIDDNWSVRAGQGLHPFSHEWWYGDLKLQTVERSLVALVFGEQRTQHVALQYQNDDIRSWFVISDGFRSQNTELGDDPADWAVTARAELKTAGDWAHAGGAYTSPRGSPFAAVLGAAVHFEQGPDTGDDAPAQDLFAWTADATIKGDGWNLFLAATGYHTEDEAGVAGADFDEYGALAQGGVYLTDDTELFARYTILIPDRGRDANEVFNAIAAGANYYIHGHAARFTIQAEWFPDPTTDTVIGNFAGAGGRNPTGSLFGVFPSDESQFTLSAQFQLMF
ncbi:MAG: porin [Planctomycetota bacterium]|nr:porin [Planctomycetota bacterium]